MGTINSPEFKKELIIELIITAAATTGAYFIKPESMLIVLAAGVLLTVVSMYFNIKKYQRIMKMSEAVDGILHGNEHFIISEDYEGELAILESEIQKMTIMLREKTEQLQTEKVRLTDAIADIFHQLRTPLTSMKVTIDLLSREELTYDKRRAYTHDIKRQTERIHWLVEALLKLSKIDAGTARFEKEEVRVADIVKKAADPFLIPMELREQNFVSTVKDESFFADEAWMVEALGNLLKNCMEHTPCGGTVKVSAEENELYTLVEITDSGEGFNEADIPHLFERFYKGKNAVPESIGIGLALSKTIISAQNGVITAENIVNDSDNSIAGAKFTIKIYRTNTI